MGQSTEAQNLPPSVSNRHNPPYFSAMLLTDSVPSPVPPCFVEQSLPSFVKRELAGKGVVNGNA